MSIELILRIVFLIIFGIIGTFLGRPVSELIQEIWVNSPISTTFYQIITTLLLAVIGFFVAPWISIKPISALRKSLSGVSAQTLIYGMIGLLVGLILSLIHI